MAREGFDPAVVRDAYDAIAPQKFGGDLERPRVGPQTSGLSRQNSLASGANPGIGSPA